MDTIVLRVISVFWIGYGIAGLLGWQRIPEKYRYQSWTPAYIRMNGMAMVILGGGWLALSFVLEAWSFSQGQHVALDVAFTLPAAVYGLYADQKSRPWRQKREEELQRQQKPK